ncbi:relaxase/mobilization nuclease domain-containing protein [Dyadobacter alkalitolerans]|uniref:relaxase/mobilization nuclease domain-containing protein n=1 Tax=Dyadobacter alkalitolerans TaxID=492736 RepID=UPI000429D82E|nr:relaxase/mobilization nuclease domain-containing protein [Dyadobacter alkalitolerans]
MIARNLKSGKFSDGLINYAFEGRELEHKDKGAEVIRYSDDLLIPFSAQDKEGIKELKEQFNERTHKYLQDNPESKNNLIGHQILSFTKEDTEKLKEDGMNKVLDDYIKLVGLEKTKFVAVRHKDTSNIHYHIVYHKVQNNYKKENDWKLNNKTVERGVALALKNKLTLVKNQKEVALTKGVLEIRSKDDDIKKLRNESNILKSAKNFHHLNKLLESNMITPEFLKDDRVKIDKKVYRPEDLHAVFYLNRNEKGSDQVFSQGKTTKRQERSNNNPDLNFKKESKNIISSLLAPDEKQSTPEGGKNQGFNIVTVNSNDKELTDRYGVKRKRRGKNYLLKNKGAKQQTQSKNLGL